MIEAIIWTAALLVLVGFALYLVETHVPMYAGFAPALRVIVILGLVLYVFWFFGVYRGPPFPGR